MIHVIGEYAVEIEHTHEREYSFHATPLQGSNNDIKFGCVWVSASEDVEEQVRRLLMGEDREGKVTLNYTVGDGGIVLASAESRKG